MAVDTRIEALEAEVRSCGKLPRHLAIIMDGNGRWAQQRRLPRIAGHTSSRETVRRIVRLCARLGIPHLTLYTFSQENWKRPEIEVRALMKLLEEVLTNVYDQFVDAIAEGRDLEREDILPYADGRIFTGDQAMAYGFVDRMGDLNDAIQLAAEMGGIKFKVRQKVASTPVSDMRRVEIEVLAFDKPEVLTVLTGYLRQQGAPAGSLPGSLTTPIRP